MIGEDGFGLVLIVDVGLDGFYVFGEGGLGFAAVEDVDVQAALDGEMHAGCADDSCAAYEEDFHDPYVNRIWIKCNREDAKSAKADAKEFRNLRCEI